MSSQFRIASLWVRSAATIIDAVFSILAVVAFLLALRITLEQVFLLQIPLWVLLVTLLFFYGYEVFSVKFFEGTPGKRIFSLKIISTSGEPLFWYQILVRSFVDRIIPGSVGMVDELHARHDPRKQTLHDRVARTIVVQEKPLGRKQRILLWITYIFGLPFLLFVLATVALIITYKESLGL